VGSTYCPCMSDVPGSGELRWWVRLGGGWFLLSFESDVAGTGGPVSLLALLVWSPWVASGVEEGGVGGRPRRYWLS
jgi:hypothetical protein